MSSSVVSSSVCARRTRWSSNQRSGVVPVRAQQPREGARARVRALGEVDDGAPSR